MIICGLDFETTGLDPMKDRIIEVGAVQYDWENGVPLTLQSEFVFSGVSLSAEIVAITGITEAMLEDYGENEEAAFARLHMLMANSDYVMAHNGNEFDQKFCRETFARLNIEWPEKLWLDTKMDIVYPELVTTRNLRHLAAEHGFLNPFAHRAVFDVLTMFKVASKYSLDNIIARAKEPTVYVQALVSYDDREKAKAKGYYWFAPTKTWWKAAKESDYLAERDTCGFRTILLQGAPE